MPGDGSVGTRVYIDVLVVAPYPAAIAAGGVEADDRALINGQTLVGPDSSTVPCRLVAGDLSVVDRSVAERTEVDSSALSLSSRCLGRQVVHHKGIGHGHGSEAAHQDAATNTAVPRSGSIRRVAREGAVGDGNRPGASGVGKCDSAAVAIGGGVLCDDATGQRQGPSSVKSGAPVERAAELISMAGSDRLLSKTPLQVGQRGLNPGAVA